MKRYEVIEPNWTLPEDQAFKPENIIIKYFTSEDILDNYWDFWSSAMTKRFNKPYHKTLENMEKCVNDWVAIYWAKEVDPEII